MENYKIPDNIQCPHNSAVICGSKEKCGSCGWNPEVAEARKQAFLEKIKEGG